MTIINQNQTCNVCAEGAFNVIAGAIAHCFRPLKKIQHKSELTIRNDFLRGKAVAMWCDSSNIFTQEKLLKYYNEWRKNGTVKVPKWINKLK